MNHSRTKASSQSVCPTCFRVLEQAQLVLEPTELGRGERTARRIRGLLKLHGISITRIAITLRVSDSFVHQYISRQRRSPRIEAHIATLLAPYGLTYKDIWDRSPKAFA